MSATRAQEITGHPSDPGQGAAALAAPELTLVATAEAAGYRPSTDRILSSAAIRIFDVVVTLSLLLILLPVIVLAVIAVRLESPGPAFFRCDRVGYRRRHLRMLKFRKMGPGARGIALTTDRDRRFTRIGRLLSKSKVDEIPQLFHVLRGDMSLVGPRPEAAEFVDLYPQDYSEILSVRPGITGLSQIAFADESRILDPEDPVTHYVSRILPQKIGLDRIYATRRSLSFNLRILAWTVAAVVLRCQVAVHRETGRMNLRKR
jgi:lipopolysaccharide/colanic/teichoic acid biosynthesis glycosyltransferase